ncbi:MAG TPA: serine hydrolase domain-containing protein [Pyrinomonadaceae bacterium]|jgi:CubicO group peptidase (beta-lactamase class C family)
MNDSGHKTVRAFLLAWLLVIAGSLNRDAHAQDLTTRVDEYMNRAMRVHRFSGTVLLARDGRPLVSRGYGMANLEHRVPNTPQTIFRIGSMTKQFTAMGILILQERGRLNVQDPICRYVPQCSQTWQGITIHHLLTHTSGIPEYLSLPEFQQRNLPLPVTTVIETLKIKPLDFRPGEQFSYSNSGYYIAGYIIERVSGKTYEAFLRESIFAPLGMSNTGYDDPRQVLPNRAAGYSPDTRGGIINAAYLDMSRPFAAGGLYSTTEDLLRWDAALYTERLLPRRSLEVMFNPAVVASLRSLTGRYGYGWLMLEQFNRRAQVHGGEINGFISFLGRFPNERVTVIVLSNLNDVPIEMIARDLAAMMFGERYELPQERRAASVDPRIYDLYAGRYVLELAPSIAVTITNEGGRLMAAVPGQPKTELTPTSETEFFVPGVNAQIRFTKDDRGGVTGLVLNQFGREIRARRVE